jgi:hypothetical protein
MNLIQDFRVTYSTLVGDVTLRLMNHIQDFRVITYSTLVGDVTFSTDELHPRFQGHILNIGGDAL